MPPVVATHFIDPSCPWGYSARPALARLRWRFGDGLEWRLTLIGLSETVERYEEIGLTPAGVAAGHREFRRRFGMPFTSVPRTRLAPSARACRAVIAAREIDPDLGYAALRALQIANFTTTLMLDEDEGLRQALSGIEGLDPDALVARLEDPEIVALYEADKALTRSAHGGPAHAQDRHANSDGRVRYTAPTVIFETAAGERLEVGGFQPFAAYDTALANLDPALERRPPPTDVTEAVAFYRHGLTTAEIAAIMAPSDTVDPDREATERELIEAAAGGAIAGRSTGCDALWFPAEAATELPDELLAAAA